MHKIIFEAMPPLDTMMPCELLRVPAAKVCWLLSHRNAG